MSDFYLLLLWQCWGGNPEALPILSKYTNPAVRPSLGNRIFGVHMGILCQPAFILSMLRYCEQIGCIEYVDGIWQGKEHAFPFAFSSQWSECWSFILDHADESSTVWLTLELDRWCHSCVCLRQCEACVSPWSAHLNRHLHYRWLLHVLSCCHLRHCWCFPGVVEHSGLH